MSANTELPLEKTAILADIERRVSEIFSAQKTEVEQTLVARISREKEEAQRRIDAVNQEFAQVRRFLDDHKAAMAELQTVEEHLRGEIRGHFERAVNYQRMMEHAAALAGGELEKIGGLNEEIEKVRVKAESVYAGLKQRLSGYAGIMAQIPAPEAKAEDEMDWTAEIDKLRQVRDLLATLRPAEILGDESDAPPFPAPPEPGQAGLAAESAAEELAASLGLIGPAEDGVSDDVEFADAAASGLPPVPGVEDVLAAAEPAEETAPPASPAPASEPEAWAEPAPGPAPEDEPGAASDAPAPMPAPADGCEFAPPAADDNACVLEGLARYRRSEPINNGLEIAFYASETGTFLDADSFMAGIVKILEAADQLHRQLTQTTSVKDLFLLKQEILNQQEILRKLFFRVVRFCDKESGRLPRSLDELIGSRGLRDVIERLTMANWSDPSDFKPFLNELKAMERAFATKTGASATYLQAVLDEVEGREN